MKFARSIPTFLRKIIFKNASEFKIYKALTAHTCSLSSNFTLISPNTLATFLALKFAHLALPLGAQASLFFGRKFH